MSFAEVVSELMYAGKSLEEIAGYDRTQMFKVVFRKRDKYGKLVRHNSGLPEWAEVDERGMRVISNPQPLSTLYKKVRLEQGMTDAEAAARWEAFQRDNPNMGKGGRQGNGRKKK